MERPKFPKRAVITGGMPYGNKTLHFGHVGGMYVHADVFARFLRDRIGKDNVVFVSGTDCYGSPIAEGYRKKVQDEGFKGTIQDYVNENHEAQKKTLQDYEISLNLFGASGLLDTKDVHQEYTNEFIENLYKNGWLEKMTTKQFYDPKYNCFLNGRQVVGKCPIDNCQSEKGYADECDLGHQYMPEELIDPKSTLSNETPEMKDVSNWYFKLTEFNGLLKEYVADIKNKPYVRKIVAETMEESLGEPVIYIQEKFLEKYKEIENQLPEHTNSDLNNIKHSFVVTFNALKDREKACPILANNEIRYRTGKTLVPLRLTGNIEWGVKAPKLEKDDEDLTVWVWPESLWAPISFTKAYFKRLNKPEDEWKKYWCDKQAMVYQFIGQDNIYFYGVAQMPLWMGQQGKDNLTIHPEDGQLQLTTLVANHHILFLDKKASSSGEIKPPMAADLLNYYTAEQLRPHFISLALGNKSVSFMPQPLNPLANTNEPDPVLSQGNLYTNVLNRLARGCFYTAQKYFDGVIPYGEVSKEVLEAANKAILNYENHMYRFELHQIINDLDSYIRNASKYWAKNSKDEQNIKQTLIDTFYMLKVAAVLSHPVVPSGCEKIADYLNIDYDKMFNWDYIFDTIYDLVDDKQNHKLKELKEKEDFFVKHPSQFKTANE